MESEESKKSKDKAEDGQTVQREDNSKGGKKTSEDKRYKRDKSKKELKTAAVLFVENTKDGELAKELREVMGRIEDKLWYKVNIVERSGTPLKLMFPLSRMGKDRPAAEGTA